MVGYCQLANYAIWRKHPSCRDSLDPSTFSHPTDQDKNPDATASLPAR